MIQTNDKALSLLLWSVQVFVYEKIKNIEQFCVFWYITMTMKFNLFRYLPTKFIIFSIMSHIF